MGVVSMLPLVANTLCCEVPLFCNITMPRAVPDQREKFENDELFRRLSREAEVRYTGHRDRPLEERQVRFQTECREGHADIAFMSSGTNLQLSFTSHSWSDRADDRVVSQEFVDFDRETGKVHLKSQFIMNGVCVMWKGWIDLHRLDGAGRLEFDEERGRAEEERMQAQLAAANIAAAGNPGAARFSPDHFPE